MAREDLDVEPSPAKKAEGLKNQCVGPGRQARVGMEENQHIAAGRGGAPACLRSRAVTSGRRWESRGVLRTIVLMWRLRLLYFLGARPEDLARIYYG